jgi:PAS domain S-box-containing protein
MSDEEKKSEQSPSESGRSWFKAHYLGLPIATYLWKWEGDDFVLIDYNPAAELITHGGVTRAMGNRAGQMYKSEPQILTDLKQCFIEKRVIRREQNYTYQTTGESKILIVIYVYLEPDQVIVHTHDVTDIRQVTMGLLESERKYKTLVEMFPHAIAIFQDNKVVFANQAAARILGFNSPDEVVGLDAFSPVPPEEQAKTLENIESLLAAIPSLPKRYELTFMRVDGSKFPGEVFANTITYKGLPAVQAVLIDVTERVGADEKLRASEERFHQLFDASSFNYVLCEVVTDEKGDAVDCIYLEVNRSFERTTGIAAETAIGRRASELLPEIFQADMIKILGNVAITGKSIQFETYLPILNKHFSVTAFSPRSGQFASVFVDITNRKLAEEMLQKSREAYRELVENVNDVLFAIDLSGIITYVSPAAENIFGYLPSEFIGQRFETLIYNEDLPGVLVSFKDVLTNRLYPSEFRIVTKTGEISWVRTSSRPIVEGNKVTGIRGVLVDINERKRAEEALRESEKRYKSLFEESPVSIWEEDFSAIKHYLDLLKKRGVNDLNSYLLDHPKTVEVCAALVKIIDINQTALDLHGTRDKKFLFGRLQDTFTQESYVAFTKELLAIWNGDSRMETDAVVKTLDGEIRYVSVRWFVAHGHEQTYSRVLVSLADISESRRMEEALRESEAKYRLLIENAGEIIVNVDYDGIILLINRSAAQALGGASADFQGKSLKDVFPLGLAENLIISIRKVFDTGAPIKSERAMVFQTGERWFSSFLAPVTNSEGKIVSVLVLSTDITEQRKSEIKNVARLELLQHLRKARNIDECLTCGCRAILDSGLFRRAVLTLHNEKKEIINLGQVGLEENVVEAARRAPAPSDAVVNKIMADNFRISHSFFVPAEAGLLGEAGGRYVPQNNTGLGSADSWVTGDELFVPIIGKDNEYEGWLSVDTPSDGKRPSFEDVQYLEEILDIVTKQVHEIQTMDKLKNESRALQDTNIALGEVLRHIDEDKMEIKLKIAANVSQILIPALNNLIKKDGSISQTYLNILKSGLSDLVSASGAVVEKYSKLSPREREICNMIKSGLTSKEIASTLNISLATVQKHRELIRRKLGLINKKINLTNYLKGN